MIAEGPQGPEINRGPEDNLHYQDGPNKGKLRPKSIRDVEQSSRSPASKARAAEFARNFETGKDKPKIGSGYDPSRAIRDTELTTKGQDAFKRHAAEIAADTKKLKAGGKLLARVAGPIPTAALTGYEAGKYLNNKFKISDRILDATMKEQILNRIYNILEEKFAVLKETLMLEANRNVIKQGRTKIIRARVRGGKVQRRKKFSAVKGYTIRGGKLTRMTPAEKRKRKIGARRAKLKRKAKMARALMKRKRSLRKRAALGLK